MKGDYGPPMNWYKRAIRNFDFLDEEAAKPDPKLDTPVLMIVAKLDPLSNTMANNDMKNYAANLKFVELEAGHWVQVEKRYEVNAILKEFYKSILARM
jgi:soluble epoxide hydrolase/lipid-phosphate phosphatase